MGGREFDENGSEDSRSSGRKKATSLEALCLHLDEDVH